MIYWTGKTTNKVKTYTAEGINYYELYQNIQEKYGHDNIITENSFESKVLEVNGENVEDFETNDVFDFEKYESWVTEDKLDKVSDDDFKDIISDSNSQAYYQDFEEVEN